VDQIKYADYRLNVEHAHGDRWVRLDPARPLDSADDDPEREWDQGRLYVCPECQEQVRVDLDRDDRTPD
jgi:hypothetical protein